MSNAQFKSHYSSGNAQFVANYQSGSVAQDISVIWDIDLGNISQSSISVTDPSGQSPIVYVNHRTATGDNGGLWRHFAFAVENAGGKTPVFRMENSNRDGIYSQTFWRPVYTTDYINWTQASTLSVGGSPNVVQFTFANPLPSGRVYIHSSPTGRQAEADGFAANLLANYPGIASPTLSSSSGGIFYTSPSRLDDVGRQVGNKPMYGIKLVFPGQTSDGLRKRKMLITAGIHAAGENQSWVTFKSTVEWILNNQSADAVEVRKNWDVWLYFLINPAGVTGGSARYTFLNSTDPNRTWTENGTGSIPEVNAAIVAIKADTGGQVDAALHFHGDVYRIEDWVMGPPYSESNASTRSAPYTSLIGNGTTIFGVSPYIWTISQSQETSYDIGFCKYTLGAKISLAIELSARYKTTVAWHEDLADKWMRTINAVDADGLFATNNLSISNCNQTDTSGTGTISLGGIALTGANCDQTDASSVNAISQLHILVPASSTQGANSGTGVITLTNGNLVAANSTQSDISGTGSISGLPSEASSISSNVFIIWNNIANENSAITHTLGSTASGFPLSNMLNDTKEKVWRSTAGTTQNIQLTWASNRIVNSFALAFTNLVSGSSVRLVLYDATVGGNILYDSGSITIDYNYLDPVGFDSIGVESFAFGGGTHFSRLFEQQNNVRRAVITLVSTSNPDGYIEVSRLVIGQAWQPEYNPDFGLDWSFDETTERVRTDAGNVLLNRGTQNRIVSFNLSHLSVYDKRILTEIIKRNGSHEPVFISILPNDSGELYQSGNLYGRFDKGNIRYSDYSRFYSGIKIEEI